MSDLFLITGSKAKVSTNFSSTGVLYVVLSRVYLPYNESQVEMMFSFNFEV